MNSQNSTIVYTKTDEAPALATQSLLPILKAFAGTAGVNIETRDISLASRIICHFPEYMTDEQTQSDDLKALGELAKTSEANIVKLPNISASIPQLKAAIAELQGQGFKLPEFPEDPQTDEERSVRQTYAKVLGSAVNPVLREGNSDRRAAGPVKEYAKQNPHKMGAWNSSSKTHVAHMDKGDFFGSEQSVTLTQPQDVKIEFSGPSGNKVLKEGLSLLEGEIIDASVMSCESLRQFFDQEMDDARENGLLLSLHLKATMMKVSDPILFGHAVSVYFKDVFEKHADIFNQLGVNPRLGLGDLYKKLRQLPEDKKNEIENDIKTTYEHRPQLAMVDSDKGITNLHVPSDVIIDASMPAAIRSSGQMWGADGKLHDTKAIIPDRCYAGVYQETIEFCKNHGAFDPKTMGSVANVGLMAKKAEEYGSHDKTFEMLESGSVQVIDASGKTLMEHKVEAGDIWRMCQTKDVAVKDWVKLAINRARATNTPAIFWLDAERSHDKALIQKVNVYLKDHDTSGLDIQIKSPRKATAYTLERVKEGLDTISVTGNVLRDYLTDLFPILELGTSAKMLSIVPLLAGGGLYETGAGGSAPKHVQQFLEENHLRWDSLGEFLALSVSIEDLANKTENGKAKVLAESLDQAVRKYLTEDKSPSRKVGELDNRGSHYYLAMYWAEALTGQESDRELKSKFSETHEQLKSQETKILEELNSVQGKKMDIGGYYRPDDQLAAKAMRPSSTLTKIIDSI